MTEKTGICKLCGEEKQLIKAHLYPKAFESEIKDHNGRFISICKNHPHRQVSKKILTLTYDPYILCKKCDRVICGKYDQYFIEFVRKYYYDEKRKAEFNNNSPVELKLDFEYKNLLLGIMVILWRHSISEKSKVNLGKYNTIFSECLKNESLEVLDCNLRVYLFGCHSDGQPSGIVGQIQSGRLETCHVYKFLLIDLFVVVMVGNIIPVINLIKPYKSYNRIPLIAKDVLSLFEMYGEEALIPFCEIAQNSKI